MMRGETFDCFLSHNSKDKSAVRALAEDLRLAGVSVWLDEEQLRPGVPWQPLLESGIRASRSIAVLVGRDGLGPWEQKEMRAALTIAANSGLPVIPVLLADAPAKPELPMFLADHTWVDLRHGASKDRQTEIEQLLWGITGRRTGAMPLTIAPQPSGQVSALRHVLFQAKSLEELKRLRNRVRALEEKFRSHPDVMDLSDDVHKAIEFMGDRALPPSAERHTLWRWRPAWVLAGALAGILAAVGLFWSQLMPIPQHSDAPDRDDFSVEDATGEGGTSFGWDGIDTGIELAWLLRGSMYVAEHGGEFTQIEQRSLSQIVAGLYNRISVDERENFKAQIQEWVSEKKMTESSAINILRDAKIKLNLPPERLNGDYGWDSINTGLELAWLVRGALQTARAYTDTERKAVLDLIHKFSNELSKEEYSYFRGQLNQWAEQRSLDNSTVEDLLERVPDYQ